MLFFGLNLCWLITTESKEIGSNDGLWLGIVDGLKLGFCDSTKPGMDDEIQLGQDGKRIPNTSGGTLLDPVAV